MTRFCLNAVYDERGFLMCRRRRNPYAGLLNFTGGHIEAGESPEDAAYRELWEETGIGREDVQLTQIWTMSYPLSEIEMFVFAGRLTREVAVHGDENELLWVSPASNFFDMTVFAGEGNIGHIANLIQSYRGRIEG